MAISLRSIVSWALRLLLTALFALSAVSKLAGIDQFEVYVYSFGFLSLNISYLASRILIGFEFLLALFLLVGWWPRMTRMVTLCTLLFFTLFLCYTALVGRNDSCQCFGQWIEMNPTQSLLKNAVLIALVLCHFRLHPRQLMLPRWWMVAVSFLAAFVTPFVLSVPDNWAFGKQQLPYSKEVLDLSLQPEGTLSELGLGNDRRVVAFVTKSCPYCKLAHEKLDGIVSRHRLAPDRVVYLLPSDIGSELFIAITHGARPLVMLLDGHEVVATYHARNIDEREVADFLKGDPS